MSHWPIRRRLWRSVAMTVAVMLIVFCTASADLFVWPAEGMPAHVDAIVVLGGPGNRLDKGLQLAHQGRAPFLVVSAGVWPEPAPSLCALHDKILTVICFQPEPGTTQGEAEFIGRLARRYEWKSVVLVTTPDQDTRARLRFARCFAGGLYVVTTPLPASAWPHQIAYQWAATFKALVLNPSC